MPQLNMCRVVVFALNAELLARTSHDHVANAMLAASERLQIEIIAESRKLLGDADELALMPLSQSLLHAHLTHGNASFRILLHLPTNFPECLHEDFTLYFLGHVSEHTLEFFVP
jgi:hypothetical protein